MDAIVLVGGEGTRLRPLTYDAPKQMLPVVDRPLVEHVVSWLGSHGVERVVLSLGYRPDAFIEAYPSGAIGGVGLVYATEPEPLDTAGAVRFAAEAAGACGRFLVVNGDVLTDLDLTRLMAFHGERGAEGTIALTPVPDPSAFGVVPTAEDGRVVAFIEKPPPGTAPTNLVNAGVYVLEDSVLDRIPTGRRVSIERETFPLLVGDSSLFALGSDAYWIDTGTPEKYLQAQLDILAGRRSAPLPPAGDTRQPGVVTAHDARIDGCLAPVAYAGPGAVVEARAEVGDSVLGAGVVVGEGSLVHRAVILAGAVIGAEAQLDGAIVGPGAVIGARARLRGLTMVRGGAHVAEEADLDGERVPSP